MKRTAAVWAAWAVLVGAVLGMLGLPLWAIGLVYGWRYVPLLLGIVVVILLLGKALHWALDVLEGYR